MSKTKIFKTVGIAVGVLVLGYILLFHVFGLAYLAPHKTEQFETIGANETAFLIPLEADGKEQGRFGSVEALEKQKLATKRVSLPLRQKWTGRMWYSYEWVPTAIVRKIDRAPVTREWTDASNSGTSPANQALTMESVEPIKFYSGATITASVLEDDAALFMFHFGGKQLTDIIDTVVRGYAQQALSQEFKVKTLDQCRKEKADVFTKVEEALKAHFKTRGLTIHFFGNSDGLTYANSKVQESIDRALLQNVERLLVERQKVAQDVRNQTLVLAAENEREIAELQLQAKEALEFQTQMEILTLQAEARRAAAARWKGQLPATILPQGGTGNGMLLQIPAPAPK